MNLAPNYGLPIRISKYNPPSKMGNNGYRPNRNSSYGLIGEKMRRTFSGSPINQGSYWLTWQKAVGSLLISQRWKLKWASTHKHQRHSFHPIKLFMSLYTDTQDPQAIQQGRDFKIQLPTATDNNLQVLNTDISDLKVCNTIKGLTLGKHRVPTDILANSIRSS